MRISETVSDTKYMKGRLLNLFFAKLVTFISPLFFFPFCLFSCSSVSFLFRACNPSVDILSFPFLL